MKIKLFTSLIISVLITNFTWSQKLTDKATLKKLHPSFSSGNGVVFGTRSAKTQITFKFDENEAYVIEFGGISISMNKVTSNDEKTPKKIKIETPKYEEKKVIAQDAVSFGRDVYLIARHEDKKADKVTLLSYRINLKDLSLYPNPKILDSYVESKGENYAYSYEEIGKENLLITRNVSNRKADYSKLYYLMFDKEMKKLWEHEVKPALSGKDFYVEDSYFKDENNLLLTCIEYPDGVRKAKKGGKPNYKYHLFLYSNKMESVKDYELDLENKFITDISAAINEKNQVVVAGFYSNKGFFNLSGCFYMAINAETKKVEKTSYKEFSDEFSMSLMSKRQKRKAKRKADKGEDIDAPQFDMRKLYFDNEGNVLLLAEDFYVVQHCRTDSRGVTTCYYTYHYDDLIAVRINKQGDIDFNIKIDKKLTFGAPVGESFITFFENGKWFFIYNENLKNMKDAEDEDGDDQADVSAGRKNSAPVMVVLNSDGTYSKEVLMLPDGKRSVTVAQGFHLIMGGNAHIIKIRDNDGEFFYRMDLKI